MEKRGEVEQCREEKGGGEHLEKERGENNVEKREIGAERTT